jgi:HK97 family phage major capsid protein
MTVLDNLRQERASLVDEIEGLMQGDFDPEAKELVEARSRADGLDTKIKSLVDWNSRRAAANEIDAISVRSHKEAEKKETREADPVSIGEAWVRSKAYSDFRAVPKGNSQVVDLPFDSLVQTRAPILTTTFAGLIQPDRIAPSTAPAAQTPLLDLINRVTVSSNVVEWVFYPAAAPLGTVTAEGVAKTEAAITPSLKTITLQTIASWAQYSRQFGDDAPGLVAFLNAALARGIQDKREAEAAAVLLADATIPVTTNTGGTLLEGIRRAVAQVETAGFRPQAVALNPQDYAALDIDVLGLTLRGPQTNPSFWGIRPVPVGAIASGTAYVGDFTAGMIELVRREVSVYTTDSHASTFTSNILTTLVEARTKPIVHRAEALTKVAGTVTAATTSAARPSKG